MSLPKYNPFDRKTLALPSPVLVVGMTYDGMSRRWRIELRVSGTNAGLAAIEKNYAVGRMITHMGKALVVTAVSYALDEEDDESDDTSRCWIVEAVETTELLNMAAGRPQMRSASTGALNTTPVIPPKPNQRKLIL